MTNASLLHNLISSSVTRHTHTLALVYRMHIETELVPCLSLWQAAHCYQPNKLMHLSRVVVFERSFLVRRRCFLFVVLRGEVTPVLAHKLLCSFSLSLALSLSLSCSLPLFLSFSCSLPLLSMQRRTGWTRARHLVYSRNDLVQIIFTYGDLFNGCKTDFILWFNRG